MSLFVTYNTSYPIPNAVKIAQYRKVPHLGPALLFFSGGTALKRLSKELISYTHNSIHLITPFDSGGSSASIREAFDMISVGDLRNRLMALADQHISGNPDIYTLFAYRFPREEKSILMGRLNEMIQGQDPLTASVPDPMRKIISTCLRAFVNKMPLDFDLAGANIGNLILTGGYLRNGRNIETVIYIFSKLVEARGTVRPIVDSFYHLVAELSDGTLLAGQHTITGKEYPPIEKPISKIFLTTSLNHPVPVDVEAGRDIQKLIADADLICYPMGSFYTSLVANLMPKGVGRAIKKNRNMKVYIPNSAPDPEQLGMNLSHGVKTIIATLKSDDPSIEVSDVIDVIIIDSENGDYPYALDLENVEELNIQVIDTEIISRESYPYIDPRLLIKVLLSLT